MSSREKKEISQWARQIRASDEKAFSALFHRTYPRYVKFAWRYTRARSPAEDVVQECFVKLWKKRRAIDPKQSLLAYLYQMVRNRALNYLRDRAPDHIAIDDLPGGTLKSSEYLPEVSSPQNELGRKMLVWIDELPGRQREAIRLSRFEGLDHEEIALVMGISPRTVNNHIVAALKTLRSQWNDQKKENNITYYDS